MTSGVENVFLRKAMLEDLETIKTLADAHRYELGFVRWPSLLRAIERGEIIIAQRHQEIIGFVEYRHRKDTQTTLYNIVVTSEWRQHGVGKKLVAALQEEAIALDKRFILLKCPEDLPANEFYKHTGFELVTITDGRRRKLKVWHKQL